MGRLDIGYHYVIERDGRCRTARPPECVGSHTPGCNHDSLSVCLAGGHLGADDFTLEQEETLIALLDALLDAHRLSAGDIKGHSECVRRRGYPCPALDMNALRSRLAERLPHHSHPGDLMDTETKTAERPQLTGQQQVIVDYLSANRSLTNLHALVSLGIGSITSRIAELRAMGYVITSTRKKDFHEKEYVQYDLVSVPGAALVTKAAN